MLSTSSMLMRRSFSSAAPTTKLFIGGQFVESKTETFVDVHNPATNEVSCVDRQQNSSLGDSLWRARQKLSWMFITQPQTR